MPSASSDPFEFLLGFADYNHSFQDADAFSCTRLPDSTLFNESGICQASEDASSFLNFPIDIGVLPDYSSSLPSPVTTDASSISPSPSECLLCTPPTDGLCSYLESPVDFDSPALSFFGSGDKVEIQDHPATYPATYPATLCPLDLSASTDESLSTAFESYSESEVLEDEVTLRTRSPIPCLETAGNASKRPGATSSPSPEPNLSPPLISSYSQPHIQPDSTCSAYTLGVEVGPSKPRRSPPRKKGVGHWRLKAQPGPQPEPSPKLDEFSIFQSQASSTPTLDASLNSRLRKRKRSEVEHEGTMISRNHTSQFPRRAKQRVAYEEVDESGSEYSPDAEDDEDGGKPGRRVFNGSRVLCPFSGCRKTFSREHDMQRHKKLHNPRDKREVPPCPYCNCILSRLDSLQRHMKSCQPKDTE